MPIRRRSGILSLGMGRGGGGSDIVIGPWILETGIWLGTGTTWTADGIWNS